MAGKIKVLEVNVDDQGNGGVYSLIKSVIENNPYDMQIDIAALEPFEKKENIRYLRSLGTRIFFTGYKGNKIKKQLYIYKHIYTLLKKGKYDVVHIHSDVANKLLVSGLAAKICGVPKIILHSHATDVDGNNRKFKKKVHKRCRILLKKTGTDFAACSPEAANWMFPNIDKHNIKIIRNGIDVDKFRFSDVKRKQMRERIGLSDDDYVIGHVGRFMYQKNHSFIIDVIEEVKKRRLEDGKKGALKLLLIGSGELIPEIRKKVAAADLEKEVIFVGLSNKVCDWMQAMDTFILPSNFEGFGISALEAQASGLPVICSDKVPKMIKMSDSLKFLPINKTDISLWADRITQLRNHRRETENYKLIRANGYDISDTINAFLSLYACKGKKLIKSRGIDLENVSG